MRYPRLSRACVCAILLALLLGAPTLPNAAQAAPAVFIEVNDGQNDPATCAPGIWTLRCAITYANAHSGTSIRFTAGLQTLWLQSRLPTITADFTWIDGHDFQNGCVCPSIDGTYMVGNMGYYGLVIDANYVTISNINVVNIPPSGADILIIGGKGIAIAYDYLGILPGATQCDGRSSYVGVQVLNDSGGSAGNNNGTAYIYANTISCHLFEGVAVVNSNYVYIGNARDGTPLGNYIGTTSDGTRAAGNGDAGAWVASNSDRIQISNNRIAYNDTGVKVYGTNINVISNTLSANTRGLAIGSGSAQYISGNKIGTSADGSLPLPNTQEGILISGGSGLVLWDNLVAYNGAAGIAVMGITTTASIRQNDIYRNGGLPIDLGNNGPTPGGGPNSHWKPYPVVSTFSGSHVEGTVACGNCFIYIFKAVGNPAAPGGGGIFLMSVPTYGFGLWSANLPNGLTRFDVTFTMLDDVGGNTSEMSPRPQLLLPLIRR